MLPALRRSTANYAAITAVTALVTQPIPVVDEMVLLPVHYWCAVVFIKQRGGRLWQAPWLGVSALIWGGVGARLASRFALGLVPPAGALANAASSAAVTVLLARYL